MVDIENFETIQVEAEFTAVPQVSHIATQSGAFVDVLKDRPKLTTPTFTNPRPAHGVHHFVKTEGPPVFAHARRLSPEKLEVAKKEFADLEALGIIRRSNSPWA